MKMLICITCYNESPDLLLPSLESACAISAQADIAIVFDGWAQIHDDTKRLLNIDPANIGAWAPASFRHTPLTLYCKADNLGKIDSILRYFDYARERGYEHVFQLDSGTCFGPELFRQMCAAMGDGADACYANLALSETDGGELCGYQQYYYRCEHRRTIWYASRHIHHVLHGQFNVIRVAAFFACRFNRYQSRLDANVRMVEDRVLAALLEPLRICYLGDNCAQTDHCRSWQELRHQRRRWINGSVASDAFCITRGLRPLTWAFLASLHQLNMPFLFGALLCALSVSVVGGWAMVSLLPVALFIQWVAVGEPRGMTRYAVLSYGMGALFCLTQLVGLWVLPLLLANIWLRRYKVLVFSLHAWAALNFFDASWGTKCKAGARAPLKEFAMALALTGINWLLLPLTATLYLAMSTWEIFFYWRLRRETRG
ncbi:hypothetical protein FEM41_14340 [Jejubacter calystegiae]|uniref:Glycosyltransferase 2-like domain-containing protein n=1 Tax=Jejubacter calystegiae TaxID=2579935 RepID=A0A4P8YJ99_9ENTR|nr:hypothetical protein [Jejubacter calystegiae]QCT20740.1 hypothetical protein FEM41_14340 [Jejubacter calystegiae]